MKFKIRFLVVLVLSQLFFLSCKNDLDLAAPYKEIPSVYAVLNPDDTIQIIRINKIFLGEGDANQMAKVADSINYPAGELQVTLNHSGGQIITFKDSVIQTAPGAFNSTQRIYYSKDTIFPTGTYTLKIKNTHTGNEFSAVSKSIAPLRLKGGPSSARPPFDPPYYPVEPPTSSPAPYVDYRIQTLTYYIRYYPSEAAIYQMLLRLHYYDLLGSGQKTYNYVDYPFGTQYLKDVPTAGTYKGLLTTTFKGQDLFASVGVSMSKVPQVPLLVGRKMQAVEYFIYSSTQDYLDYLEYSKPSFSISQTKPIYSNFKDRAAIGIFTFRYSTSVKKEMWHQFVTEFAYNPNTCMYRFYTNDMNQVPCAQ